MRTKLLTQIDTRLDTKEILIIVLKDVNLPKFLILNNPMESFIISKLKYSSILLENKNCDLRKLIRPYIKDYNYVIILQSNMPLISNNTIDSVVEYVQIKNSKACKLPSGWAFNCDYLRKSNVISIDSFYSQNEEEFKEVNTDEDRKIVEQIILKDIINYHIKNGVIFKSNNVLIEPNVAILSGTEIYSNVQLKGNTKIGRDCLIKENSVILDSIIGNNVSISNSNIEKSKIGTKTIIMPYCFVLNSQINNEVMIKSNKRIENMNIASGEIIE